VLTGGAPAHGTVTDANSVAEALILFTEGQFDLVVTDFE